jgi:hypothetical protein
MGCDLGLDRIMRRVILQQAGCIRIWADEGGNQKSRGGEEGWITISRMRRGNGKCTLEGRLI